MRDLTCKILQGVAVATMTIALCGATHATEQQTPNQQTQARATSDAKAQGTGQRGSAQRQQAGNQSTGRTPAIVIGELVEMREVNIEGQGMHRLLKLQPRGGEDNAVVVDVGAGSKSAVSELAVGDRVIAVGRPGRINDRPVIVAQSIGEFRVTGMPGSSGVRKTDE